MSTLNPQQSFLSQVVYLQSKQLSDNIGLYQKFDIQDTTLSFLNTISDEASDMKLNAAYNSLQVTVVALNTNKVPFLSDYISQFTVSDAASGVLRIANNGFFRLVTKLEYSSSESALSWSLQVRTLSTNMTKDFENVEVYSFNLESPNRVMGPFNMTEQLALSVFNRGNSMV